MADLEWVEDVELRQPIMVVALKGLFDAAEAATAAIRRLREAHGSSLLARIDPESFYDFTQERPTVELADGGIRRIRWPANECFGCVVEGREHDLLLVSGVEPHLRWRTFSNHLVEIAERSGAEMVVTVGAMVGLAPHTRPLGVVGSSTNEALAKRLGLGSPTYQGPTGLVGALHDALDAAGIPVISLRAAVPHYVPGPPNPEATRSLLRRFEIVTGLPTNHTALDGPAEDWRRRIDAAVASDEELTDYVQQLEQEVDESDEYLPTGEDLAAQLEAFLREQRSD